MTSNSRRARSSAGNNLLAAWYREHGWPHAEAVGSGRNGVDVTGLPGLACEHKGADEMRLRSWLDQASARPGLAYVVYQGRGMGKVTVARWPVIMRLDDHTILLRMAGFGDAPVSGNEGMRA